MFTIILLLSLDSLTLRLLGLKGGKKTSRVGFLTPPPIQIFF